MASGDHARLYVPPGRRQEQSRAFEDKNAYLAELIEDARTLDQLGWCMTLSHGREILGREMERVSQEVRTEARQLEETGPQGDKVKLEAKVPVPCDQFPSYNFIGRILGPRGMSVKQMEQETGCRILVRGQGSVKDAKREERLRGKDGWEHLDEPLHILIICEDSADQAEAKLEVAKTAVERLLTPSNNDNYKRRQLIELAIINGNYRPTVGAKE